MVIIAPICMRLVTNNSYPWPDLILLLQLLLLSGGLALASTPRVGSKFIVQVFLHSYRLRFANF